jgi:hypothetical protein
MIVTGQVPLESIAAKAVALVGALFELADVISMLYVCLQKRIPENRHFLCKVLANVFD